MLWLLSHRALIQLEDGTEGIIRNRELVWHREPRHPNEVLVNGELVKVLVLGIDPKRGRLELSLAQAERAPLEGHRFALSGGTCGATEGSTSVTQWSLWELESGIDVFVPLREICTPTGVH